MPRFLEPLILYVALAATIPLPLAMAAPDSPASSATLAAPATAAAAPAPGDVWDGTATSNPLLPGYYADPSLLVHEGTYYIYATLDPWGGKTLGCWSSTDFRQWTYHELNWPTKAACSSPTSTGAMVWAPSVVRAPDGRFMMYVSVGSEVWVGTASSPLGPWSDAHGGKPLINRDWNRAYHMIDAEAFVDDDGHAYLYWGSGLNWVNGHCFAVPLAPDMVTFAAEPRDVTPGNYFEGPFMFKHADRYYLMYSAGKTTETTYQVHYAIGDAPLGPFTEAPNSPCLVTDATRHVVSPGHHAAFHLGGKDYILYHRHSVPFVPGEVLRQTCVDPLEFTADGLIAPVVPTHLGADLVRNRPPLSNGAIPLAGTVTATSSAAPVHGPACVLDNNYATLWRASSSDAAPALTLDLGAVKAVRGTELRPEYAWLAYPLLVEASNDGTAWTTLADSRSTPASGSPITLTFPAGTSARYLRLAVLPATPHAKSPSDPGATPALFEWAVY